jgi:hypothetical protein
VKPELDAELEKCSEYRDFNVTSAGGLVRGEIIDYENVTSGNTTVLVPRYDWVVPSTKAEIALTLYPSIDSYCKLLHRNGPDPNKPCTYGELQTVISRNSKCYREAYSYCVYETYGAIQSDGDVSLRTNMTALGGVNSGMAGSTVCTSALGGKAVVSGVVVPVIGVVFDVFKSTATGMLVLVLLLFFLVIGLAVWARRR